MIKTHLFQDTTRRRQIKLSLIMTLFVIGVQTYWFYSGFLFDLKYEFEQPSPSLVGFLLLNLIPAYIWSYYAIKFYEKHIEKGTEQEKTIASKTSSIIFVITFLAFAIFVILKNQIFELYRLLTVTNSLGYKQTWMGFYPEFPYTVIGFFGIFIVLLGVTSSLIFDKSSNKWFERTQSEDTGDIFLIVVTFVSFFFPFGVAAIFGGFLGITIVAGLIVMPILIPYWLFSICKGIAKWVVK